MNSTPELQKLSDAVAVLADAREAVADALERRNRVIASTHRRDGGMRGVDVMKVTGLSRRTLDVIAETYRPTPPLRTSDQAEGDLIAVMTDVRRAVDEREAATANRNSAILAAYNAKVKVKDIMKVTGLSRQGVTYARRDAVTDT